MASSRLKCKYNGIYTYYCGKSTNSPPAAIIAGRLPDKSRGQRRLWVTVSAVATGNVAG